MYGELHRNFSKGLEITSIGKDQKEMLKYLVTSLQKLIDLITREAVEYGKWGYKDVAQRYHDDNMIRLDFDI